MTKTDSKNFMIADGNVMTGTIHTDPVTPSLRTAAAIAAMQGILSNAELSAVLCNQAQRAHDPAKFYAGVADGAVKLADALLTELEKEKE